MKQITFFIALLALLCSCSKSDLVIEPSAQSPVFTCVIDGPITKTSINTINGKVSWENDDEITITDGTNTALYSVFQIGDNQATFVKKSGDELESFGVTYTATYGTAPSTSQIYSETAGKLPMTATSSNHSLTFNVSSGLLKISLAKTGESIKKITVTGTPAGGIETTYSLTCESPQSIGEAKDFYVALPAGSYYKYAFYSSDAIFCEKTAKADKNTIISNNTISSITFTSSLNFNTSFFTIDGGEPRFFNVGTTWYDYANSHSSEGFAFRKSGTSEFLYYNNYLLIDGNQKIKKTVEIVPGLNYSTYR